MEKSKKRKKKIYPVKAIYILSRSAYKLRSNEGLLVPLLFSSAI